MGAKRQKREPHHQTHEQPRYRTGRFWQGPINLQQNAVTMRRDYIRMTAKLIYEHGENCFARHNLDIKA